MLENKSEQQEEASKVIEVPKKLFFGMLILLAMFLIFATVLTYVLDKGNFAVIDGSIDYTKYIVSQNQQGINILKVLLSPILVFGSSDAISVIMLSIFLCVIGGTFQMMSESGGIQVIIEHVVYTFRNKQKILLSVLSLCFMCFGSFFGIFEESLAVLFMIISLCVALGYNSYVGFLVCIVSTGMGFACAITNPFTVLFASKIIHASITHMIWFRILIFIIMYLLLQAFIMLYLRKFKQSPANLESLIEKMDSKTKADNRLYKIYAIFLISILVGMVVITAVPVLRDISIVCLTLLFLIGGFISGGLAMGSVKKAGKVFLSGAKSVLPAVILVVFAFAVKYILVEGNVLDTITNSIRTYIDGKSKFETIIILFAIMLVLEFFISSSTAKVVFIMGILSGTIHSGMLGFSKELLILIYIFSDGFANILFPTSPVLLIGLSMSKITYGQWLKKGLPFLLLVFAVAIVMLYIALAIGY